MQATQNNMGSIMNGFRAFMNNPVQSVMQHSIPKEAASDPNKAIQYLMDTGKITQAQYMQAKEMMSQITKNPTFKQFFN